MNYNFEWDPDKAKTNLKKYKISFENAATIFTDPLALTLVDNVHSDSEDRWITMGISGNGNILVVVHTFKDINENNTLIRIITARKATKREIRQYQGEVL